MKPFIHDDFLLRTQAAARLYHEHAHGLPIIDYHCHLDPRDLADNRAFANLTQAWIANDPYKHRAMRIAGVPEHFITGPADDREKFDRWASVVPLTLGNPLFHWTALELKRYFNIDPLLTSETASDIWDHASAILPRLTTRSLLSQTNVHDICTSDRLLDSLSDHTALAKTMPRVLPSLRADDLLTLDPDWIGRLAASTDVSIDSFASFHRALSFHLDRFASLGCVISDHGLDDFRYVSVSEPDAASLFDRLLRNQLDPADRLPLSSAILLLLGQEYARRGWAMQLHLGAQRKTSTRLRTLAGPAGGYATIGSSCDIPSLCRFLDDLEQRSLLPRTILYPLNPADFVPLATLTGSFAQDNLPGKIQLGPAWWYNDHQLGIRWQLDALAHYGLLSTFVGMTTDSRSILSLTRHEYFRRVLCDWIGDRVESGDLPGDESLLSSLIRRLCFDNARTWLFQENQ